MQKCIKRMGPRPHSYIYIYISSCSAKRLQHVHSNCKENKAGKLFRIKIFCGILVNKTNRCTEF
jgi:hypothetical protein